MTNLGLIGCGWISQKAYLPLISRMSNVSIKAIYDSDLKKMHQIQSIYRIRNSYDNISDLLNSDIDGVIITTTNDTHTYYSNLALKAGKHVLCEKPIAFEPKDVISTLMLSKKNNKLYIPALVNRFRKDVEIANEFVSQIGKITQIEVSWIRESGIPRPGTWITNKKKAGGGALIDIGTHMIDIGLMYLTNKNIETCKLYCEAIENAVTKEAMWNKKGEDLNLLFDVETDAKGEVMFENGVKMKMHVSWASNVMEDITEIKVLGENGTVDIKTLFGFSNNYKRNSIAISMVEGENVRKIINLPIKNNYALSAFEDLIYYFVEVINGGNMKIIRPIDGFFVVNTINQLYKSIDYKG